LFWIIGTTAIGGWSAVKLISSLDIAGHKILLIANSCFSISSVVSVFYLGSLCQVNSVFGPLQLSTLRMVKDISKFLTVFLGLFFAFTLGVRNLYSYNRSLQLEYISSNSTAHNTADQLSTYVFQIVLSVGRGIVVCNFIASGCFTYTNIWEQEKNNRNNWTSLFWMFFVQKAGLMGFLC
jgi:hypothetical protein